jgi:hypothetical protein
MTAYERAHIKFLSHVIARGDALQPEDKIMIERLRIEEIEQR